ncbi:MAG: glycosyltransferase family 4 protein [Prosthecobacter sp.]
MNILISHLTGNPNSCAAGVAFAEVDSLAAFHTTLVVPMWLRRVIARLGRRSGMAQQRMFPELLRPHLRAHPAREMLRLACRGSALLRKSTLIKRLGSLDKVLWRFDTDVAKAVRRSQGVDAVYAYMGAAEKTFEAARQRGIQTIYELPTPYWRFTRDIVAQEAVLQPGWASTLPALEAASAAMQRRDRELQLADLILVPSAVVRDSLQLAPAFRGEVCVIPYGCPEPIQSSVSTVESFTEPRLRILYVGSLNQGKGLAYLAEAMDGLADAATLTVIGSRTASVPSKALDRFLSHHRHHAGLSHHEVLAEMCKHDVLVLPTLYEGLALVLLEAMSCGLTVITTENSGLAGLIEDGREGFLVPLRDPGAIRDRLRRLADIPVLLQSMRRAALDWSHGHSWQRYREQLRKVVLNFMV